MVRGHEVHQAEVEHLHPRQRGDLVDVAQRAVRLDQRVDRDLALHAGAGGRLLDVEDHLGDLRGRGRFRDA